MRAAGSTTCRTLPTRYLRDHSQTVEVAAVDFGGGPMSLGTSGTSERVIGTHGLGQLLRRARHTAGARQILPG